MDYERLVARHKDAIYRQMVRVCGNHEDAEDVLVEALVSAYRASAQLRDESAFRGWVATIGKRVCGRIRKKEALATILSLTTLQDEFAVEPSSAESLAESVEMRELHSCIRAAIESLPDIYRDVYWMREIDDVPAEQVGLQLGLSIPAVKSRLHRARAIVRATLDESLCAA